MLLAFGMLSRRGLLALLGAQDSEHFATFRSLSRTATGPKLGVKLRCQNIGLDIEFDASFSAIEGVAASALRQRLSHADLRNVDGGLFKTRPRCTSGRTRLGTFCYLPHLEPNVGRAREMRGVSRDAA